MNETLNELLETVRAAAAQAGNTAADVAYASGKKAGELLETAKMNIRIVERNNEVKTKLQELGALLYATHTGNPTESEVLFEKMQEIDALKAEIAQLEAALGREHKPVCAICGAVLHAGDRFCRECGEQV